MDWLAALRQALTRQAGAQHLAGRLEELEALLVAEFARELEPF